MGVESVKEVLIYSPKYSSFVCSRAAVNVDTVDRLKMPFGQCIFVHSDAGQSYYSSSTYSLYAAVNKRLRTKYYRLIVSSFADQRRHSRKNVTKRHPHLLSVERHSRSRRLYGLTLAKALMQQTAARRAQRSS